MRTPPPPVFATFAAFAAFAVAAVLLLAGCRSTPSSAGTVPTLSGSAVASGSVARSGSHSAVGSSGARVAALHAAAQCIRMHGVPAYQDPVLTADGHVYTDSRSIEDAGDGVVSGLRQACGSLVAAAGLSPADEPPAPSQLVQVGVAAARCMRAHGLPAYRDPTSSSPFTPGHGFGISADELPDHGAGGKLDPTFQAAMQACRAQLDAEIRASELSSLARD